MHSEGAAGTSIMQNLCHHVVECVLNMVFFIAPIKIFVFQEKISRFNISLDCYAADAKWS